MKEAKLEIAPYENPPPENQFHFVIGVRKEGDVREKEGTRGRHIDLLISDPIIWPKNTQMEAVALTGAVGIRWVKKHVCSNPACNCIVSFHTDPLPAAVVVEPDADYWCGNCGHVIRPGQSVDHRHDPSWLKPLATRPLKEGTDGHVWSAYEGPEKVPDDYYFRWLRCLRCGIDYGDSPEYDPCRGRDITIAELRQGVSKADVRNP